MSNSEEIHQPIRTAKVYSLPALIVMVTVVAVVFALVAVFAFFFLVVLFVLLAVGLVLAPLLRWLTGRRPLPARGTLTLEGEFRDAGPADMSTDPSPRQSTSDGWSIDDTKR